MKKIIIAPIILILTIILIFVCVPEVANCAQKLPTKYLLDYSGYQKITPENIKSLRIIRYTEGGANERIVSDKAEINRIYDYLKRIKLTKESNMSCTDNTTVYSFVLQDDTSVSVEIECDWIVIKGKNYKFKLTN